MLERRQVEWGNDLLCLTVWETTVHPGGDGMGAAKWDWLLKSRWIKRGEWQCPLTVSSPPEVPKPLKGCHSLLSKIVLLNSTSPEHSNGHIQWCTLLMPQVFIDPIKLLMTTQCVVLINTTCDFLIVCHEKKAYLSSLWSISIKTSIMIRVTVSGIVIEFRVGEITQWKSTSWAQIWFLAI